MAPAKKKTISGGRSRKTASSRPAGKASPRIVGTSGSELSERVPAAQQEAGNAVAQAMQDMAATLDSTLSGSEDDVLVLTEAAHSATVTANAAVERALQVAQTAVAEAVSAAAAPSSLTA